MTGDQRLYADRQLALLPEGFTCTEMSDPHIYTYRAHNMVVWEDVSEGTSRWCAATFTTADGRPFTAWRPSVTPVSQWSTLDDVLAWLVAAQLNPEQP